MKFGIPLRLVNVNRRVRVKLGHPGSSDLVARLPDVFETEEKLGGKIGNLGRRRIVEGQALDASKGNVLGDFNTEALEADNEHVRGDHAPHRLVAQHIELAAIEGLIDFGRSHHRLVNLHPSDEIDPVGMLLVLRSA